MPYSSELEVDEGLHLGRHELIDDEDGTDADKAHEGKGKAGEGEAIPALGAGGQPMDDHAEDEEEEDIAIAHADIPHVDIP